jgi:predicted transposase YdaD
MLLEEFDVEKYERTLRKEGREDGFQEGREDAIRRMLLKGMTAQQVADIFDMDEDVIKKII